MNGVRRISTGIPGLDSIIGGFPVNSNIVMQTQTSNYTDRILQQFSYQALIEGSPALYITISRSPKRVLESMKFQGMDVDRYAKERRLVFVDLYSKATLSATDEELPEVEENVVSIHNIDDPDMLMMAINAGLGTLGDLTNIRMVVDSTPEVLAGLDLISFLRFWRMVENNLSMYDMNILFNYPSGIRDDYFRAAAHHADVTMRLTAEQEGQTIRSYLCIDKIAFTPLAGSSRFQMVLEDGRAKVVNYRKIS